MRYQATLAKHKYGCDYDAHAAYWLTKLGLSHDAFLRQMITGDCAEEVCQLIGVSLPTDQHPRKALRLKLKRRLAAFKQSLPRGKSELFANTRLLAKLLQLNKVEQRVIEFAALSVHHRVMRIVMETVVLSRTEELINMLSVALDCRVQDVRAALDREGTLIKTKLLECEFDTFYSGLKLTVSEQLIEAMHTSHKDVSDFVQHFIERASPPTLTAKDFPHLAEEIQLMEQYLASVTKCQTQGVNILIYGSPGVGKSELVRALAMRIGIPLFQVKSSDSNYGVNNGFARLVSFSLGQRFLRETNALILFDEMEDVFPESGGISDAGRNGRNTHLSKAWVNELLETNPVPTIWVSNEVSHIDPAYLRRFDFSVEICVPPIRVRKRIIKKHLRGTGLSKAVIDKYARQEELSPAQVEKAAKVLRLVDDSADRSAAFELVLDNSMALLDQTVVHSNMDINDASYRLEYLNADCDLLRLVEQLKQADLPQGAMCFYGAPGTGKSALAHYLSRVSERPLLTRRASDILSPYVGVAEQNIAQMFKRAEQDEAILLLDEADSLLADRKGARASWEVSQVNEMLTQMESFKGLFICSTNLMTRLDEASLRRFALKIRFDYLKHEQRWQLFSEQIGRRVLVDEKHCRSLLNKMNNLTPGDFACIRRQARLLGENLSPEEWINRLQRECRAKPDQGGRQIGFM